MQDVFYIETVDQARTLLTPHRLELLKQLDRPRTCPELAAFFGDSAQKVYYHVKALEHAGLVEKVGERRVRGAVEGSYQAKARSYWLAPDLVGGIGSAPMARDQASLGVLCSLAEEILDDVGHLAHRSAVGKTVHSLSLTAEIELPDGERRAAFMRDVQQVFEDLARSYGAQAPDRTDDRPQPFRLVLACYPRD